MPFITQRVTRHTVAALAAVAFAIIPSAPAPATAQARALPSIAERRRLYREADSGRG